MLISEEYRKLNAALHDDNPAYGSMAHKYASAVAQMALACGDESILDYGCGKGTLKPALLDLIPGLAVHEYDPAIPDLDQDPDPQDLVVAFDVMEHIEPECLDDVLSHIQSKALKHAMFFIANVRAKKLLPDGRNAHLIVEDRQWWERKISHYFDIHDAVDAGTGCLIICTALPTDRS